VYRSAARAERKRKVYEKARILNEVVDAYRRESPEETVDHHVSGQNCTHL
jgi:hypothetical protein